MNEEFVRSFIQESMETKKRLLEKSGDILKISKLISAALRNGNKILFAGNGGSSSDASHIATELVVRYKSGNERRALPAISLASDSGMITACGNDYGFEDIFSRQIEAFGSKGDVFVAITTSGNSPNILKAVQAAKKIPITTVALLGGTGGKLKGLTDAEVIVPSSETARIQESHILIGHIFCSYVEKELFSLD